MNNVTVATINAQDIRPGALVTIECMNLHLAYALQLSQLTTRRIGVD